MSKTVTIGLIETKDRGTHVVFRVGNDTAVLHPNLALAIHDQLCTLLGGLGVIKDDDDDAQDPVDARARLN